MFRHRVRNGLLIIGLLATSFTSSSHAQEPTVDAIAEVKSKVIKLRNKIEEKTEDVVTDVSSRAQRLAANPLADLPVAAPSSRTGKPQVAFDEIKSNEPIAASQVRTIQPAVAIEPATAVEPVAAVEPTRLIKNQPQVATPIHRSESAPFVTTSVAVPEFVNVNEVATAKINVQNQGKVAVHNVKLVATVPQHVEVDSRQAIIEDGQCTFHIDTLEAGETRQLLMDMVTKTKQPLDIETALTISNRNRVAVGVRQPELKVSVEGPNQTNIGSKATHVITVTNTGDGVATGVNLIADMPESLRVIQKTGFEKPEVLAPGQQATATIVTVPQAPGQSEIAFAAEGSYCKSQPAESVLRVTQPELQVSAIGPDMNFVERDGIYTITVNNPGEVDVNNVAIQFAIPDGVRVTTISRQAEMDTQGKILTWQFDRVASQTEQTIQLKAVASNEGPKQCRIRVASDETNEKEISLSTIIATRADLSIRMQNIGGPVQVGTEAAFVVVVENRGSSVATDMEIEVQLPAGMRPASPKDGIVDEGANSILFADSQLAPGKTREFSFSAIGVEKGEHVVRSALQSVGSQQRIIVENSVFVYEPAQARVSEKLQPVVPRR